MLACATTIDLNEIKELQDFIGVNPPLKMYDAFVGYYTTGTAESILALQRCEELLHGFLRCDGIIVMGCHAQVIAYRVFYRGSTQPSTNLPVAVGGARRRAYEGIKSLAGKHLSSILFRSQDGLTLQHGAV
jgi:hypothetical protein